MTRAERIKSMDDGELAAFLFKHGIENIVGFMKKGGEGCMNFADLREWLAGEFDVDNDKLLNNSLIGEDDE
jgi:hypothetical protein